MKCLAAFILTRFSWVGVWLLGLGRSWVGANPIQLHILTYLPSSVQSPEKRKGYGFSRQNRAPPGGKWVRAFSSRCRAKARLLGTCLI